MRWLLGGLLGWAVLLAHAAEPLVLDASADGISAAPHAQYWLDASGRATLEQARAAAYAPMQEDQIFSAGRGGALWMRVTLAPQPGTTPSPWLLEFPAPVLDLVTVYLRQADGRWSARSAGDTVAVATWPDPGRYPVFRLDDLPRGAPSELYVRLQHVTPISVPMRLAPQAAHEQRIQVEYMGMGMAFGALALLITACLAQAWVYRDRAYLWYSSYALLMTLAVAAYTGAAGHLLWPHAPFWTDASQGVLSVLAGGAAVLFVRHLAGLPARQRWFGHATRWLGNAGPVLAVAYLFLHKPQAAAMAGIYLTLCVTASLAIAVATWRRGDIVGLWILGAYLPLGIAVLLVLLRVFGWLPISFGTQYAVVIGSALEVPLLLVALSIRSRERHGAQIREQALSTQDALTGLLAPHLFHDRLRQVVARYKRDQESAAVVYIDLVNHARIKEVYGTAVAEQSLLRAVIKLRRLLRDMDTVSRIGEARFGVILEGVDSRAVVTDRAARLIAAGLMPLQGLKPDVTLQFHIAAVLLDERAMEASELGDALSGLMASMSSRTRRPIRFLQPELTLPAALGPDSSLLAGDEEPAAATAPR
jgi:diguanylate cyclase (GGDEF)-like protein